jgi:hypothetical protein
MASVTIPLSQYLAGNLPKGAYRVSKIEQNGDVTLSDSIGYVTGQGGAVTQITSATTGVTLNKVCGQITTVALTLAAGVDVSFTLTNSEIAANDVVVVSTKSYGGTADGIPIARVSATAAGSCVINIINTGAVALDALAVISFAVIKGVAE